MSTRLGLGVRLAQLTEKAFLPDAVDLPLSWVPKAPGAPSPAADSHRDQHSKQGTRIAEVVANNAVSQGAPRRAYPW